MPAGACPRLISLHLGGCSKITHEGLRAVAAACPRLTTLLLPDCRLVTMHTTRNPPSPPSILLVHNTFVQLIAQNALSLNEGPIVRNHAGV